MGLETSATVTFVAYLFLTLTIGFVAQRYTRNLSDYILGGRRLGAFVTALSAGASDMSGWLLMGLPGAVFAFGLSEAWVVIGLIFGAWLNWTFVAGRLRVHTEVAGNALTLPDYFSYRFEDEGRSLRIISAVLILSFFAVYCASGMVASARLFETAFGMPYETALYIGAVATVAYVLLGGFLAVSWTDTVQASLMIFALLLVPMVIVLELGSVQDVFDRVVSPMLSGGGESSITLIGIISLLAWGLGYFGQPHILTRFMAADSVASIPKARRIGMTWMVLCLTGAVLVGLFGSVYFAEHPDVAHPVQANHERIFMYLSSLLFDPWVVGILFSAILSAIMSTLSCQLLVCASALTEDLYRPFFRKNASQSELVCVSRIMVFLVALGAVAIAWDPDSRVLALVGYAWAGFGAGFGPVVLLSLMWSRMTKEGAFLGIACGALTVIFWGHGEWFGYDSGALFGLYELVPGFIMGTLGVIFGSLWGGTPSQRMVDSFLHASHAYREGSAR